MEYSIRTIRNFVSVYNDKNLIARYSKLLKKSFNDPDNLHKLDNLVEICDYENAVDIVGNSFDKQLLFLLLIGLTQREIAEVLHSSQSTINRKFNRLCNNIKQFLEGKYEYKNITSQGRYHQSRYHQSKYHQSRLTTKRRYRDLVGIG